MNDLILSIIIPVYNTEKYLTECIESIVSNTEEFEVLLIDDGSTDNSGYMCDMFTEKDKRIKVIHKKNGGVSSARNLGIEKANGKYVMFVDSDDMLEKSWYQSINFVEDDDFYIFDKRFDSSCSKEDIIKYIIGYNDKNISIPGPFRKIIKRETIINNNIKFKESIINGEDMLFNLEVLLASKTFKIVPYYYYYYYRQAIGQSTRSFNKKIISSDINFHKQLDQILSKYNISNELKNELEDFCKKNAIITIVNRISYIASFDEAKKYYSFLDDEPYKSIINDGCFALNKYQGMIFNNLKKGKFNKVYRTLRLKNKISILIKKIKNEELKII